MPIYIQFDGIKGDVTPDGFHGGANFGLSDGSVKNIGRSIGGGPRVTVYPSNDHAITGRSGRIFVSRISVPNLPTGLIDERDANAGFKARFLFEGMKDLILARGLILSVPRNGTNKFRHDCNLKQLGLAAYGRISTVQLVVTGSGNTTGVAVELENVLITNYSISGFGGAAVASQKLLRESLMGEGKKVKIDFCK